MLSKAMQLIVANKMQQLDEKAIQEALSKAMLLDSFNIFEFSKQFF